MLQEYLKSQREHIVDSIEGKYIPIDITTEPTFNHIATQLQKTFLIDKYGRIGGRDHAHNVLAMAIICSLWCGWMSQAKANKNAYPKEVVNMFKQIIIDAFEIGRELVDYYSP